MIWFGKESGSRHKISRLDGFKQFFFLHSDTILNRTMKLFETSYYDSQHGNLYKMALDSKSIQVLDNTLSTLIKKQQTTIGTKCEMCHHISSFSYMTSQRKLKSISIF